MKKLKSQDIISLVDQYRCDDYLSSLDRAELSRHFGGGALDPGCENMGLVGSNNWLQGYKYLNRAYRQIFSVATSDAGLVEVRVKHSQTPERRRRLERAANQGINKVLKESRRFRYHYAAACGDAVLYGSPYLYKWNKRDWIPTYAGKPLMPRDAPADVNDDSFVRWAFTGDLSARSILEQLKLAERSKGARAKWNTRVLRQALKALKNELDPERDGMLDHRFDEDDPETLEYQLQANAFGARVLSASLKVYYFFQKQPNGKVDAYIINRHGESVITNTPEGLAPAMRIQRKERDDDILFCEEARFDNVNECLWPMILDVKFGGKPQAHRVQGLGRLNYELDCAVSYLINAGLAGLEDDFTPLYQAKDNSALKKIDAMIAAGVRRGSVFPSEVLPFEKGSNARNYGNLMAFMNIMDVGQSSNASSHGLGQNSGKTPRELEVQAIERQAQNQQDITSRMEDWVDMGTPMVQNMVKTLVTQPLQKGDRAFEDREKLKNYLEERGLFIEELDPSLIEVSMRKHLGAGDNQLALQRAETKVQNLHLFPAQSHPIIIREWVQAVDDSAERALELVPEEERPNRHQLEIAAIEESNALATGVPPMIQATTIPEIHLSSHLRKVANLVQQNQQTGIDQYQANGIAALLEHSMAEAQIVQIRGNESLFEQFEEAIKHLAKAAQEITVQPPPPKEQVELELKARNQALQEAKHQAAVEKNTRAQDHREEADQQRFALSLNDTARKDREMALKEEEAFSQPSA